MDIFTNRVLKKSFDKKIDGNNQKYSQEYCVLAALRYLYPDRFRNLNKTETPDLLDNENGIGIEVTVSVSEIDMKAMSEFSNLKLKNSPKERKRTMDKIRLANHSVIDYPFVSILDKPTGTLRGEEIVFKNTIEKKLKKLNTYREKCNSVGLAVLLLEIPTTEAEECFIKWINEIHDLSNNRFFDFYFILCHRFALFYDCNTKSKEKTVLRPEEYLCLKNLGRMTAENEIHLNDPEWVHEPIRE